MKAYINFVGYLTFEIVNFDEQGPRLRLCHLHDFHNRCPSLPGCILCSVPRASIGVAAVGDWHTRSALRPARSRHLRLDWMDDAYYPTTHST